VRIDFCIDCEQIAFLTKNLKKLSEILNGHVRRCNLRVRLMRGNDNKTRS
jgi:hypothetical protein